MDALASFHPAVREWFARRFAEGPTEPQAAGWPAIASGHDTLIAAPTGSGKTLAAFLVAIDRLFRDVPGPASVEEEPTRVVYVSPLKALAADIHQNLETPLAEIRAIALTLGLPVPDLRVLLRTGDTPSSARAAMVKRPPHLLVTTPESLYLLVTAAKSRERLRRVSTIIVDEIHAVARDKRGAHLMLTLERLEALCGDRPQRIGLSATQRPIESIARLLVGAGTRPVSSDEAPRCRIVDLGHRRALDLGIELPGSPLEAVASHEQWGEILDKIAAHVDQHRTTLVFVNTRRLAERLAHLLAERVGSDRVAAHHGSLSKERRLKLESRLRAGDLKALVATASLELGIDIGPVELVCQIGSPRSIATFLQRVGRSNHSRAGIRKGRLYPLTRDELVECTALLGAVRAGRLDAIEPPVAPLDILAQQIVAEVGAREWTADELYALVRRAAPYAALTRAAFDDVIELVAHGVSTGRGPRGRYVFHDAANGQVVARPGGRAVLGVTPTLQTIVLERFFDETGGMQLVIHSPYGGRINRAFGLALRKKFCRSFNFELQAAATDDAIVLSLGPHHSFPLDEVPNYLSSATIQDTLEHAILDSPMFQARWRWNLNRSLMVLRFRNGLRNHPPIQRMESDDLMAAVFPQAAACQENVTGPIEIPDHVLVRQTISDTLHEALDVDGT